jgi:hypothetical protein
MGTSMKIAKITGGVVAALIAGIAIVAVVARFSDGPIGMFPGGPFTTGKMTDYHVLQWQQFRPPQTIELQLAGEDTSRTTWVIVNRSTAYIPASLGFPPGKTWHLRADENGRAIIRMRGELYDVRLDRISDPETEAVLAELIYKKYATGPPSVGSVWYFKLTSMIPIPGSLEWKELLDAKRGK